MEYTILILLLPFLSFLLLGIGGKWMTHRTAGIIGTTVLGVVAVLSYVTAVQYFSAPRLEDGTFATWIPYNVEWLPFTETLTFNLGILLDPISVMMLIVLSTVSLMVHIYSFGYTIVFNNGMCIISIYRNDPDSGLSIFNRYTILF